MWLTRQLDALYDATLALVYPMKCAACGGASVEGRRDAPACAACWQATTIFTGEETCCWKCGAEARGDVPPEKRSEVRCRRCDEWAFTAARALGRYEGALRAVVLTLKQSRTCLARLAQLLCAAQSVHRSTRPRELCPCRSCRARTRRGFNQARCSRAHSPRAQICRSRMERHAHRAHVAPSRGDDRRARRETVERAFQVNARASSQASASCLSTTCLRLARPSPLARC